MNCCQAASLITMLRPLLSYNAGARGFCLSSFFDKSYWPLRRFWPCGDGDAYCQTFLPQIACTNERNQMPGAEFLISWVGVGGGGVTHSCMGFWDVKSRGPARFRHQLDQAKGDLEKWSLFFLLSKWPWQHVETCWKNMLSCYPLVNKGGNGKPIMCRCLT